MAEFELSNDPDRMWVNIVYRLVDNQPVPERTAADIEADITGQLSNAVVKGGVLVDNYQTDYFVIRVGTQAVAGKNGLPVRIIEIIEDAVDRIMGFRTPMLSPESTVVTCGKAPQRNVVIEAERLHET
jgi:hypothetical protein